MRDLMIKWAIATTLLIFYISSIECCGDSCCSSCQSSCTTVVCRQTCQQQCCEQQCCEQKSCKNSTCACPPEPAKNSSNETTDNSNVNVNVANNDTKTVQNTLNINNTANVHNEIRVGINVTNSNVNNVVVPATSTTVCNNTVIPGSNCTSPKIIPYPVITPVPIPIPVPYPIPVHYPRPPRDCCYVKSPCVSQGCQSYSKSCGSYCSGSSYVYQPRNPCEENTCYRKSSWYRRSCQYDACSYSLEDCSQCSEDWYSSYESYSRCHGCFYT